MNFLPCNHLILAKSRENLTVCYLTLWLVHSLNYTHRKMCTFVEGGKEEVAHQVIIKNTHSAISLLPDFQATQEGRIIGKALLRRWRGAFIKGATLQKKLLLTLARKLKHTKTKI